MKKQPGQPAFQASSYRYERKFLVGELSLHQVRALVRLHPALFIQPYPPRSINNIYLDTPDMDCYYENVAGVKDRRKVRVRWYGELFGSIDKPILEFKIKDGLIGKKESSRFPSFVLDEGFNRRYFQGLLSQGNLPEDIRYFLRDLDPVLVNRYYRWYYATPDGHYRVTVDAEMAYFHIDRMKNSFRHKQVNYLNVVVELKYSAQYDPQAGRVSQYFPFPVSKNSKYVEGIERVYV